MVSARIVATLMGAACVAYASGAEARVVRSGGSSDTGNFCDTDNPSLGPFIGLYRDSDGALIDFFNDGSDDDPIRPLVDDCLGSSYEFYADEQLEFEPYIAGEHGRISMNEFVDSTFIYQFGSYQLTSDTFPGGPFDMPAELRDITDPANFFVSLSLMMVAEAGYSFFACEQDQFDFNNCIKTGDALGGLAYGSGLAFMQILPASEVPVPGAVIFMLTGLGGLTAMRRKTSAPTQSI